MILTPKKHPSPPNPYLQEAKTHELRGDFTAAIEAYQKAKEQYKTEGKHVETISTLLKISELLGKSGKAQTAETHCNEALQLGKIHLKPSHSLLAKTNLLLGKIKNIYKSGIENIAYLKEALRIYQLQSQKYSLDIANTYTNIGLAYFHLKEYENMNLYLQKSQHLFHELEQNHQLDPKIFYNTRISNHLYILLYYLSQKDSEQALVHFNLGVNLLEGLQEVENMDAQIEVYFNLGNFHFLLQKLKPSIEAYEKALALAKDFYGLDSFKLTLYHERLATAYLKQGDWEKGLESLLFCADISLKTYGVKSESLAHSYSDISNIYFRKGEHTQAIEYLQKSIISLFPDFHNPDIYTSPSPNIHSIDSSILIRTLHQKALILFALYQENPTNQKALYTAYTILLSLHELIDTLFKIYPNNKDKRPSTALLKQVYLFSIKVGLQLAKQCDENDQADLAEDYRKQTFHFSEKYRGNVLLQKMMDTTAKNTANLPVDLLQKEQKLQQELAQLNAQIQKLQAGKAELNILQISQWQAQYFDKQQEYEQLIGYIEAEHPDYFQLKYNPKTVTIADLQKTLSPKTALVSYSIAPNFHHVFVVTQNDFHSLQTPVPFNLSEKIQDFKEWMQAGIVDLFTQTATELYQILLQPIEAHLNDIKSLIFIPDDSLNYLPFECLLIPQNEGLSSESENDSFSSLPYLIQSYKISYHHSATLLHYYQQKAEQQKNTKRQKNRSNSFFGLAPVSFNAKSKANKEMGYIAKSSYSPNKSNLPSSQNPTISPSRHRTKILKSSTSKSAALADLNETETEVKTVFQLFADKGFEATALFYNQATKENLQKYLKGHKYVLLSTHGFVDEKNPAHSGLFLYQNSNTQSIHQETKDSTTSTKSQQHLENIEASTASILHTSEAYLLELDADLVVLSSCESGIGRLQKGEGMLALNRAFMQAGASNIIYSLFKIPQDTTSELTQHLFQHILEGDNYATALQKAKLALIEQEEVEPRDWAGLVLLGN